MTTVCKALERLLSIVNPSEDNLIDIEANVDYLNEMLTKDFWTTEDLTPLRDAIK